MEILGIVSAAIIISVLTCGVIAFFTKNVWLSAAILWLAEMNICFDMVPEGFVSRYESGGKFFALACSYGEFGPVKAPGDLDWAIRRVGESDTWKPGSDSEGTEYAPGEHTYVPADFYWDRRLPFIKKLFGENTGIVWMGVWPTVKARYFNLRISNYRTVKPNQREVDQKQAELREYKVDGDGKAVAGYLLSWNELTKRAILSDDTYPIPIDGVRIGIACNDGEESPSITADLLVIIRYRIREPRLFYRVEDAFETIQNEMIQHIRVLCASLTIKELYTMDVTLESDKVEQNNLILSKNEFGRYIRERYGISVKGAGIAYIGTPGEAGKAFSLPFIAKKQAEADAIRGDGQGRSEANKIRLVSEATKKAIELVGAEQAALIRASDVATAFAESGKSSTVVFGFDPNSILGAVAKAAATATVPKSTKEEK
jgi:hypothetical protein